MNNGQYLDGQEGQRVGRTRLVRGQVGQLMGQTRLVAVKTDINHTDKACSRSRWTSSETFKACPRSY
uniref:Uncharacterized protein n=1 Tax=Acrobeloides nanus TaxID=290746 RepID=A0A914EJ26_9BILA